MNLPATALPQRVTSLAQRPPRHGPPEAVRQKRNMDRAHFPTTGSSRCRPRGIGEPKLLSSSRFPPPAILPVSPIETSHRRGQEAWKDQSRRGRSTEKASSFHGRYPVAMEEAKQLRRPRTLPDLRSTAASIKPSSSGASVAAEERPRLTKLLLNVTIQGSLGPVQVVMTQDSSVADLIATAMRQYVKEGRRPVLRSADPTGFDLHYSQFSLESLGRDEKLMTLGSRNFFLCPRKPPAAETDGATATPAASCSKEAEKATKTGSNWLKFMAFLL
ncbi:hypothetical protein CRG98_000833 [Punica granatum]|uniref:DUF7054 domain-containing protein n=1 Tax=Punica granatum TaxID=22663 RepID=A0A2I0LEX8_PUNGR|nr:hypothetical protein CRG98_000833 [Punica granatum]